MNKKPPIHVWREPVDDATVAVIAFVEFVVRGGYYAASAMKLMPADDWRWRQAGKDNLLDCLAKQYGGRVPYVRRARDQ